MSRDVVLSVRDLKTYFYSRQGLIKAVNGVGFDVEAGRTLGIVGESGCGKTVTALSILGLIDSPGRIVSGEVKLNGKNLLGLSGEEIRKIRGKQISLIFQDPMTSLNPVLTIGTQVTETILSHEKVTRKRARQLALEMLDRMGLPQAHNTMMLYPPQLSGGMRQRVMIAMALALNPQVLIADEPTTALDVTIQAQILAQFRRVKRESLTGMILISHDLRIVAEIADEIAVMYAGSIVEHGDVCSVFDNPCHPYTRALLSSIPHPGIEHQILRPVPGQPPSLLELPEGCTFLPRCEQGIHLCRQQKPSLISISPSHSVACHRPVTPLTRREKLRGLASSYRII